MKISTKSRYGLKAIIEIAKSEELVSLRVVAENLQISESYLEQIITKLKKQGYIESIRGVKGGYKLSKEAKEILLGDLIEIFEGSVKPANCVTTTDNTNVGNCCSEGDSCTIDCLARSAWNKVFVEFFSSLNKISLQNIIDRDL